MIKLTTYTYIFSGLLLLPGLLYGLKGELRKCLKLPLGMMAQLLGFLCLSYLIESKFLHFNWGGIYLILSLVFFLRLKFIKTKGLFSWGVFFNLGVEATSFLAEGYFNQKVPHDGIIGFTFLNAVFFYLSAPHLLIHHERRNQFKKNQLIFKSLEEKLFNALKESEKSALIPGLMHELSHPVTILNARIAQLKRSLNEENTKREVFHILDQMSGFGDQFSKIIQHTREFIYEHKREKEIFQFSSVYKNLMVFWDQRLKNHGVSFRYYPAEEVELFANPREVEQIFLILIHYSFELIEFLPNKWIELTCVEQGDELMIQFLTSETRENLNLPIEINFINQLCYKNNISLSINEESQYLNWVLKIPKVRKENEEVLVYH